MTESPKMTYQIYKRFKMFYYLNHYGLLKVSGTDAKKLLQGQLTCNMDEVHSSEPRLAALCNLQGRVLSLFYVFQYENNYYLLIQKDTLALTQTTLNKYAIFYKAQITEISDEYTILGQVSEESIAENDDFIMQIAISKSRTIFIKPKAGNLIDEAPSSLQWQLHNIHDRLPSIYRQTSGKFLPHDINLPELGAISFNKGCYTGQEIIARMHYRAKLKNHLYFATINSDDVIQPGADIYYFDQTPKPCGIVVDVCNKEKSSDTLIMIDEKIAQRNKLFLVENQTYFNIVFA